MAKQAKPVLDRIFAKAERTADGCLLWRGNVFSRSGHGKLFVGSRTDGTRRSAIVSRVVWEEQRGPIPEGLGVLHKCDHPPCVEVDHLFLGTDTENMADRDAKGRQARGERAGRARLTSAKVKTLRFAHAKYGISITDIARRYGVTYQAIRAVILCLTWRHV